MPRFRPRRSVAALDLALRQSGRALHEVAS